MNNHKVLKKNSKVSNSYIKNILLTELNWKYECKCGLTNTWEGTPLNLQLDHIDGNNTNNEASNLRFLCPNCHSQTDTYCGKSKNKGNTKVTDEELKKAISDNPNIRQVLLAVGLTPKGLNYERVKNLLENTSLKDNRKYCDCGTEILKKSKHCPKCRITKSPDKETLEEDIKELNWCAIGRKYGVSDNAVRKWAKKYALIH